MPAAARTGTAARGRARPAAQGRVAQAAQDEPRGSNVVPLPTIALLRTASLPGAAQQEIERMILAGEIAPGAKLTEAWLSERLGISRGPIREAFRMLAEAGLVRQEKNRGVFVRAIPLEEAVEIYDLRAVMDELVGRRLAACITPEQTRRVKAVVDQMDQAARIDDADTYHLLNLQFHDLLVEFAGNRKMAAIYRKLVKELALFRRRNLAHKEVLPQSAAEHRQILKAIGSGDPELAARAMFNHVTESKARMLRSEAHLSAQAAQAGAGRVTPLRAAAAPSTHPLRPRTARR
jgi:phosphonate utilization transcriptional regulator